MNIYLYKCSHNIIILTHRKFNDDIFACFVVIMKNVIISFIKEYRRQTLRLPRDAIDHHKNNFFGISWNDRFISEVKLKLCSIIQFFSKWPPFWARDKLSYRKLYRKLNISERYPLAFPTFWTFYRRSRSNIDGDVSISKFDLLCDLVTSSMKS